MGEEKEEESYQATIVNNNNNPWTNFLRGINCSATSGQYQFAVRRLMKFLGITEPAKLLEGSNEYIENALMDFIAHEKQQEVSAGLVRVRMSAIKKFYKRNRKKLDWDLIYETIGKSKRAFKDKPYTKEMMRKALDIADRREKVIILAACSTGIRRGAMPLLQKKHHEPIDEYNLYKITVYAGEDEEYLTYSTPEYRMAADDYFAYRQRCGEVITDDSYLLRNDFDANDTLRVKRPYPITEGTISDIMERLMEKAGVRKRFHATEAQRSCKIRHEIKIMHGFRKFYDTQMSLSGVSEIWIQLLEGHKIGLKGNYFRPTEKDLLTGNNEMRGYIHAINALTISDKHIFELENQKIRKRNEELEKERQEVTKLRKELEPLLSLKEALVKQGLLKEQ